MRWLAGRPNPRAVPLSLAIAGCLVAGLLPRALQPAQAVVPGVNGEIAFSSNRSLGGRDIWRTDHLSTTPASRVTTHPADDLEPAWSPDGKMVAFERNGGIVVRRLSDGTESTVTSTGTDHAPSWNHDGTAIAFARAGTGIVAVSANGTQTPVTSGTDSDPSWSPDGNHIAFSRGGDILRVDISVSPFVETNLTTTGLVAERNNVEPTWSPDGSRIAFSSDGPAVPGDGAIWTMNASDGSEQNVRADVPDQDDGEPTWSPDGTKIAFASTFTANNHDLYIADTNGLTPLDTSGHDDNSPSWQALNVSVSTTRVDFGNQPEGETSAPQAITVTNNGTGPAKIKSIRITGGAPEYAQTHDCPIAPNTLGAGQSCTVRVTFEPATTGTRTGTLEIIDDPIIINLTGAGTAVAAGGGNGGATVGGGDGSYTGGSGGSSSSGSGATNNGDANSGGNSANGGQGGDASGGDGGSAPGGAGGNGGGINNTNGATCTGAIQLFSCSQVNVLNTGGNGANGGSGGSANGGSGGSANGGGGGSVDTGNASSGANSSSGSSANGGGNSSGNGSHKPKKKPNCKKKKNKNRNYCKKKRNKRH